MLVYLLWSVILLIDWLVRGLRGGGGGCGGAILFTYRLALVS